MIVIRLARGGRNKRPFYRIVVADKRYPRDGRFIEQLGYYNPVSNLQGDQIIELDLSRVTHWVDQGAQLSPRVKQLVKRQKNKETASK